MHSESYNEWISLYTDDIKTVWDEEKAEFRKMAMLYCAFQQEINRLQNYLHDEMLSIKSEFKKKSFLKKQNKFTGLAFSEKIDIGSIAVTADKENETPEIVPLKEVDLNELKTEDFLIEATNTNAFNKERSPSPQANKNITAASPVLRKNSFTRQKRICSTSPSENPFIFNKPESDVKTPSVGPDDSNIMECSIIEDTTDLNIQRKNKRPRLQLKKRNKSKLNNSKQTSTLTQMFFEPPQKHREIDSNLPSMTVTEMINLINESSSSETGAESDETVDNLDVPSPSVVELDIKPGKKKEEPEYGFEEVVRGKERKKLKGWSCRECEAYYEALGLPPDELQKKKDQCSKHRFKFKPRVDTYEGFWDLTFGPTPKTQPEVEESLNLNYKQ